MGYPQNALPLPNNFAEVSFPQELTPPDVDPDEGETNLYAYNPAWSKVLAAACDQLTQFTSWQGDSDQKKLAVDRALSLKIQLQEPVDVGEREVPAPYWDDDADVEDEAPPDEQTWYGKVLDALAPPDGMTFEENARLWVISGFLAIPLVETGPGAVAAAILFHTAAVRLKLAFNRGDVIEGIRIIIDHTDYGTVDTTDFAPGEQTEVIVDGIPEMEGGGHDILLVVTNPA